ncbi:MAG: cytochrome B6, partial [Planctomycetes bacterium]|nr:cytochrome B6 [Planctomycetota bacterium]
MRAAWRCVLAALGVAAVTLVLWQFAQAQEMKKRSSYAPVVIKEDFDATMKRMAAAKPEVMKRQMDLLKERYDLSDRPARDCAMSRGKAVQEGVRVKLPQGITWEKLAAMT